MKALINIDELVMFRDLDTFKNNFLPLYNDELTQKGEAPVKDEQDIINLFLDLRNEWTKQTK